MNGNKKQETGTSRNDLKISPKHYKNGVKSLKKMVKRFRGQKAICFFAVVKQFFLESVHERDTYVNDGKL